jgi:aminopeptidase N
MRCSVAALSLLLVVFAVAACLGGAPSANAPAASAAAPIIAPSPPAPPPARDDGRLPVTAIPQRYALALQIDPAQPRFSGVATIQIEIPQPTWHIVMHGRDLHVTRAVARLANLAGAPSADLPATTTTRLAHDGAQPEELVLSFPAALPAGTAMLEIAYDAPFSTDLTGLYRVQEDGRWYAFTQFETTDARRAFPCFDEPGFKTVYDVTIAAPRGMMVLTNAPEKERARTAGETDGQERHTFETSRPMPSYLVAFAIGDFDVAEGQKDPFPIRVITTKGKAGLSGLALEAAAALVAKLGDYFDVRYPYPKLDLVAVPDFAYGAMENAGLITFRDVLLLADPKSGTRIKRLIAQVIAHELAHQWFGDLVTMQWWDDLWLNEGFATWAEAKVVDAWKPSFGASLEAIADMESIMDVDALRTARAVRQPVRSTSEAMEIDKLVYSKGASILRMIESWLGPETFRRGVQRYVHENAWKNARAEDLFAALEYVSTQKVGQLASGFLDRSGVPEVLVSWKCGVGGKEGARVELRASEWRPLGAGGDPARAWTLPVCVASDVQKARTCFTLGAEPIARDLGASCPSWLYPNAEEAGYYRFVIDKRQLQALARSARALDSIDRLGLVSNAWAEVRQGALDPNDLLDLLPAFDGEGNHYVREQIAATLHGLDHGLVDDTALPAFRRFVAARMAGRKAALGWEPARGAKEDDERALERATVLETLGATARDKATLAEAEKYAAKWLADPASIPADTAEIALPLAAIGAGVPRLEQLRAAAKNAKLPEQRMLAIRAMGWIEDGPTLRKALDLALTDEIKLSELRYLFRAVAQQRGAGSTVYAWEKENWAKLRERVPGSYGAETLVGVAGSLCTRAEHDDAQAFFAQATRGIEGVQRKLDEALEKGDTCVALRERGAGNVSKYFGHR